MSPARSPRAKSVSVRLLYFAVLRDRLRCSAETCELPGVTTEAAILRAIARKHPALAPHLPSCRVAVNGEFAQGRIRLKSGDEVAILPPVAGG